jgi:hypothetical protein
METTFGPKLSTRSDPDSVKKGINAIRSSKLFFQTWGVRAVRAENNEVIFDSDNFKNLGAKLFLVAYIVIPKNYFEVRKILADGTDIARGEINDINQISNISSYDNTLSSADILQHFAFYTYATNMLAEIDTQVGKITAYDYFTSILSRGQTKDISLENHLQMSAHSIIVTDDLIYEHLKDVSEWPKWLNDDLGDMQLKESIDDYVKRRTEPGDSKEYAEQLDENIHEKVEMELINLSYYIVEYEAFLYAFEQKYRILIAIEEQMQEMVHDDPEYVKCPFTVFLIVGSALNRVHPRYIDLLYKHWQLLRTFLYRYRLFPTAKFAQKVPKLPSQYEPLRTTNIGFGKDDKPYYPSGLVFDKPPILKQFGTRKYPPVPPPTTPSLTSSSSSSTDWIPQMLPTAPPLTFPIDEATPKKDSKPKLLSDYM